jgi:hypothetical protein
MDDIIERLEKSGQDRRTDLAISAAINYRNAFGKYEWKWSVMADEIRSDTGGILDPAQFVPLWTRSIDAAVKLVRQEGLYWLASEGRTRPGEPLGGVQLRRPGSLEIVAEAEHEKVAVALCIAVFKARAALNIHNSVNKGEA